MTTLYNENLSIGTFITPKDYKKAFQYFLKAAQTGDFYARLIVGEMYHCGYGTKQDFTKAAEYYKSVMGHTPAKSYLGLLYAFGEGVDYDIVQAFNHSTTNELVIAQTLRCGDEAIRGYKASYSNLLRSSERQYWKTLCLLKVDENQPGSTKGVYSVVSPTYLKGETEYLLGIMNEKGQGTRDKSKLQRGVR